MRRGLVRSPTGTRLGAAASRGRCTRSGAISLRLFEVALVLVRLDHVASFIVNANHSVMGTAAVHRVADLHYPACHTTDRPNGSTSEMRSTPRLSLRGRTS